MPDPKPLPRPEDLVVPASGPEDDAFSHPLNPRSEVHGRELGRRAGLRRVGVAVLRIPPGKESFVFHRHRVEEEFMFVLAGRGVAEVGDATFEIGPGDFLGFPPATHAHHVRNPSGGDLVYVSGGESLPLEVADFPREDLILVRTATEAAIYPVAAGQVIYQEPGGAARPLPEPRSLLFTASERAATPEETTTHPMNPRCEAHGWALGRRTGLERVGVNLVRIPPGRESSILHLHHAEEEFAYVLSGRGTAELGDARLPIGPGDFLGFPAGTLAHVLVNDGAEDLVVLAGGERRPLEVVDFPRDGKRAVRIGAERTRYPLVGERHRP
jgi:quercetin 2,3-dioxygenase